MSKYFAYLVLSFLCTSLSVHCQEVQNLSVPSISNQPVSMGVVDPFSSFGGVPAAYHLVADYPHTDSALYTLHEISFGGVLQATNSFDLGTQLPENHHLLHQVVKDSRWYVFGYEKLSADSVRYFVSIMAFDGNSAAIEFPLNYQAKAYYENVRAINNADILNGQELAFVGNRTNIGKSTNKGLVILFNTDNGVWQRLEVRNDDSSNQESVFPINAFTVNDSLYVLEGIRTLSVYDSDYNYIGSRAIPESVSEPGNAEYDFMLDVSYVQWGDEFVFSGRSSFSNRGTSTDYYCQFYDDNFDQVFDERYYNVPREITSFRQSFYPLSKDFGVMVSQEFGIFGTVGKRNLYLRLFDRNTTETTLKALRNEEFSHFADGLTANKKLLLIGFSSDADSARKVNLRYYLADYSETIVGINERAREVTSLTIYPNPAKSRGRVNLSWSGMQKQNWQVKFYDKQGRLVHQKEVLHGASEASIQLPELPSDNYIIRAEGSGKQVHTGTLVVE